MKEAIIDGGATLWARQTIESEIFYSKPAIWFKIWFYLVNRVSHKDTKKYKRGETFYFQEWVCNSTGATPDQVKKCLSWLREKGMISTRRSTRGTWLKIAKYSHFQRLDNYYYNVEAPDKARQKHDRSTTEARRYNKNDKNEKNEKVEPPPKISKLLIDTLLEKTGIDRPDGDYLKDNLYPAKLLAKLIATDFEKRSGIKPTEKQILNGFINIITKMEDFHKKNATYIGYFYKNFNKIINSIK